MDTPVNLHENKFDFFISSSIPIPRSIGWWQAEFVYEDNVEDPDNLIHSMLELGSCDHIEEEIEHYYHNRNHRPVTECITDLSASIQGVDDSPIQSWIKLSFVHCWERHPDQTQCASHEEALDFWEHEHLLIKIHDL